MITIIPAYGRDYKSKREILEDWNNDKDFLISDFSSPDDGRYINKTDAEKAGITSIKVRYKRLNQVAIFNFSEKIGWK